MARDTREEPSTDGEFDDFEDAMAEQAVTLRAALVEDLGGEPEDCRTGTGRMADDGGK